MTPNEREWGELIQRLEHIDGELIEIKDAVERLDEDVRGNGKPGLKVAHHTLESRVNGLVSMLKWAVGVLTTVATTLLVWQLTQ